MQKVVHITTVHIPSDTRIMHKECKSLAKKGYKTFLLCNHHMDTTVDGVEIIGVGRSKNRFHRMTSYLWRVYRKALRLKADIYHFHDPELILLGLMLKLHRKKVIYDVHEDVPRDILLKPWLPQKIRKLCAKLFEKIENFSAKFFDAIIVVTPLLHERFAGINKKTTEIRNYPKLREIEHAAHDEKSYAICYAGLLSRERGIFEMINSAATCNVQLNLAGNFNCAQLHDEVIELPQWNNVNYLGYLNNDEIRDMYRGSRIGLAILHAGPTYTTSLPIKLFEYMEAGLPVIVSHFPLWQEIVNKHDCGICVNPQNIDEICDAIYFLLNNTDEAKAMGQRGKAAVQHFYNWKMEERKLWHLYNNILQSPRALCAE